MIDLRNGGIVAAWHEFCAHAGECEVCGGVQGVVVSLLSEGESKDAIRPHFAEACPTGEPLLWAWDMASQNAVGAPGGVARRLFVWEEGADREDRVQALMALPSGPFQRLLAIEDDARRKAQIDAITRAYLRRPTVGENGLTRAQEDEWVRHYASHRCLGWYKCSEWQATNPPDRGGEKTAPRSNTICPECGKEVKPGGMGLHRAKAHRR